MSRDIKTIAALGLITCGVILATVVKIEQIANVFAFVSPILMVVMLVGTAAGSAKTTQSINAMKEGLKRGRLTPEKYKVVAKFKPATYNILNVLYLSIVLLFASYGYFANAFFWLVIWGTVNVAWQKHEELYKLYERTVKKHS